MILMTYCLLLYNIPEFRMVKTFAEPPAQDVVLRMPLDVVLDDEGYLYCLDGLEKKVIVWGEGGDYIRALGGSLGLEQDFVGPMAKQHRMFVLTLGAIVSWAMDSAQYLQIALLVIVITFALSFKTLMLFF